MYEDIYNGIQYKELLKQLANKNIECIFPFNFLEKWPIFIISENRIHETIKIESWSDYRNDKQNTIYIGTETSPDLADFDYEIYNKIIDYFNKICNKTFRIDSLGYNKVTNSFYIRTTAVSDAVIILLLPIMYPQAFSDNNFTEEEANFIFDIASCKNNRIAQNISFINKRISPERYKKEINEIYLKEKFTKDIDYEIRDCENEITRLKEVLARLQSDMENALNTIRTKENKMLEFERDKINGVDQADEVFDFVSMLDNVFVSPDDCDQNYIYFDIKGPLDNFDVRSYDLCKDVIEYHNLRAYKDVFRDMANRKKVLDALFNKDPEYNIMLCAKYGINRKTFNYNVNINKYDPTYCEACSDCIPNPHMKQFGCLGGYETYIREAAAKKDVCEMISLFMASVRSVDPKETTQTFCKMLDDLFTTDNKCIYKYDGTEKYSPVEFLNMLLKEDMEE